MQQISDRTLRHAQVKITSPSAKQTEASRQAAGGFSLPEASENKSLQAEDNSSATKL